MFESVLPILESIPAAVYAATTASTITLIGLWLQNRGESMRNIQRLDHDAQQRDREREMTVRREVYLKAAEAMAQAQEYLASLANIDISLQQHEAMVKGVGADLNKVHIVGSMPTVQAIVEANQFFAHAVSELSIQKLPIRRITHEIEYQQMSIESAAARRDEALASMKEMTRAGIDNQRAWNLHHKIFNDEQNEMDVALAKKEKLQNELAHHQADFVKHCAQAGLALGRLVVNANLAIRRELELGLDAEAYRTLMKHSHERLGREVDEFHQKIKQTGTAPLRNLPLAREAEYARRRLCALTGMGDDTSEPASSEPGYAAPLPHNVTRFERNRHGNGAAAQGQPHAG